MPFELCAAMKWTHLPVAGGLYDQDPERLRKFSIIFAAQEKFEAEQRRKEEAKNRCGRRVAGR